MKPCCWGAAADDDGIPDAVIVILALVDIVLAVLEALLTFDAVIVTRFSKMGHSRTPFAVFGLFNKI